MTRLPISLHAALTDATTADPTARNLAITHLATAYLEATKQPSPSWQATAVSPDGPLVRDRLHTALLGDPVPAIRALAAVGLGQLGASELLDWIPETWADDAGPDAAYLRECLAIAWILLGTAASDHTAGAETHAAVIHRLQAGLGSPHAELRFQCATGLAELLGPDAEALLVAAVADESVATVRAALVDALGQLDPPGPAACEVLACYCNDKAPAIAFAAALGLTAARDPRGGPQLLAALARPADRGRALEALAALGPLAPPEALPKLRRLASGLFVPALTRVRAAYALARLVPSEGHAALDRLARARRASVREAVADARAGLQHLAARDQAAP